MSYILDALKRAEAERDPEARASLAMAQHERRRNRWLAYAVVIALIANAAILLWLFLPEPSTETATVAQRPAQQPSQQEDPATRRAEPAPSNQQALPAAPEPARQPPPREVAAPIVTPQPAPARPNTRSDRMAAEAATGETIIGPNTMAAPVAEPLPVSSLPSAQRQRFPALEFSTHIYADDAELRAIVVNGTRLEEGDRLGNLRLQEITEDGAIFRFEDRLVSVSVLDAWN